MIEICFRYMAKPETFERVHKDARNLSANWSKAFEKLRYELARIGATDVIIEAGYQPSQVRADGWPYSTAKAEHSAVRVGFRKGDLPVSFSYGGWREVEMNIYMIALTLERLRAVDRYGCTKGGEQYKGWAQLPPGRNGSIEASEWPNIEAAQRFLMETAEITGQVNGSIEAVYRQAARKAHPDITRDNGELMSKVNRARDYIEAAG